MGKTLFPSLNGINGQIFPYGRKIFLRHYHCRSDPKLGPGVLSLGGIPCSLNYCTTPLSLPWNYKIKDACNNPIYERVYGCKYSMFIVYHNTWIVINFIYYGTDKLEYEHIHIIILYVNVNNISFIISKVNYGALHFDDTSCHGY